MNFFRDARYTIIASYTSLSSVHFILDDINEPISVIPHISKSVLDKQILR